MDQIRRHGDIREVLRLDAFIIGPLGKGLPLKIVNVTGRISKRIGRHIHNRFERWSTVWEDEGWVVVAAVETGAGKWSESLWCRGSPWSSGEFWGLLELEGRHTLGLRRPIIWRGRLPPKLCCLDKVTQRLESRCSSPWRTCPLGWSLRMLSHSWLREDEMEWGESHTGPEDERVPEFCWTEIWNGSLPACECRLLPYCYHSTPKQSDCVIEFPTEVGSIWWLQAPASWCAERILGLTTVLRVEDDANWLPKLLEMHPWRTGWVLGDVEVLLGEHLVCCINWDEQEIPHAVVSGCPMTVGAVTTVFLSRTVGTWDGGAHDG